METTPKTEIAESFDLLSISKDRLTIIYILQAARKGLQDDLSQALRDIDKYEYQNDPRKETLISFAKQHASELKLALDGVNAKLDLAWKSKELTD